MKSFAVAIQSELMPAIAIELETGYYTIGKGESTPIIATTFEADHQGAIGKVAKNTGIPEGMLIAFELAV